MDEKEKIQQLVAKFGEAVKNFCTCGTRGPTDALACPACLVWHEMKDHLQQMIR